MQSREPVDASRAWTPLEHLTPDLAESTPTVLVRARLANVRGKGKSAFLVLRQRTETLQAIMFADEETVSRGMVKYASAIPKESIVDVEGILVKAKEPIASCTQSGVELKVLGVWAISRAAGALPFELVDASRSDADISAAAEKGELLAKVEQNVRLDNRALDLRTPASQAIFRVQSAVCQLFRNTMLSLGFQEIHTPKLISGASEGGAAVFAADYMGRPACLAQSPQLYKQMAIVADFDRVFEIGPVFRAENSFTHRHLCEFTGLDFEMQIRQHYGEVMEVVEKIFMDMFKGLEETCGKDLAAIKAQYPFEPIVAKPLRLAFEGGLEMVRGFFGRAVWPFCLSLSHAHPPENNDDDDNHPRTTTTTTTHNPQTQTEGIQMLRENGYPDVDPLGDLNTELERALGAVVKKKHGTDFFILYKFPLAVRPFYTMPSPDSPDYSNSFDVFIRGEEIISGAQRVHDADLLTGELESDGARRRAPPLCPPEAWPLLTNNIPTTTPPPKQPPKPQTTERAVACGVPVESIRAYIDSFRLGAPPHGGAGVGLERVVMLYCGLNNIRKTSMFPRDPKRLEP